MWEWVCENGGWVKVAVATKRVENSEQQSLAMINQSCNSCRGSNKKMKKSKQ